MPKSTEDRLAEIQRRADLEIAESTARIRAKAEVDAERIAARERAREDERRKITELRNKLEIEHRMVGHPKAELLWSKAWEHGHSAMDDVGYWYSDLVELVR